MPFPDLISTSLSLFYNSKISRLTLYLLSVISTLIPYIYDSYTYSWSLLSWLILDIRFLDLLCLRFCLWSNLHTDHSNWESKLDVKFCTCAILAYVKWKGFTLPLFLISRPLLASQVHSALPPGAGWQLWLHPPLKSLQGSVLPKMSLGKSQIQTIKIMDNTNYR